MPNEFATITDLVQWLPSHALTYRFLPHIHRCRCPPCFPARYVVSQSEIIGIGWASVHTLERYYWRTFSLEVCNKEAGEHQQFVEGPLWEKELVSLNMWNCGLYTVTGFLTFESYLYIDAVTDICVWSNFAWACRTDLNTTKIPNYITSVSFTALWWKLKTLKHLFNK